MKSFITKKQLKIDLEYIAIIIINMAFVIHEPHDEVSLFFGGGRTVTFACLNIIHTQSSRSWQWDREHMSFYTLFRCFVFQLLLYIFLWEINVITA